MFILLSYVHIYRACVAVATVIRLPVMNFGKLVFGALLIAAGGLFLAIRLGYAPPDAVAVLLPYWPLLLVAFGLAFLASAIKNTALGVLAALVILGGVAFGVYWAAHRHASGETSHASASYDLTKQRATSLTIRTRMFGGSFAVDAASDSSRSLDVELRNVAGSSEKRQRFVTAGGAAIYEWPVRNEAFDLSLPGAELKLRVPRRFPVRIDCTSRFSLARADLTQLRAERCEIEALASSVRIAAGSGGFPEQIRIKSRFSVVRIILPDNCSARLTFESRWNTVSVPPDFMEHALGRSKGRVFTSDGGGRMIRISVKGGFNDFRVERIPRRE